MDATVRAHGPLLCHLDRRKGSEQEECGSASSPRENKGKMNGVNPRNWLSVRTRDVHDPFRASLTALPGNG
jgi:hypothetical protein